MIYRINTVLNSSDYLFFDNIYREDINETIKVIKEQYTIIDEGKGVLLDKQGRTIHLPFIKKKGRFIPIASIEEYLMESATCTLDLIYEPSSNIIDDKIVVTKSMMKKYRTNPNMLERLFSYHNIGYPMATDSELITRNLKTPLKLTPFIEEQGENFLNFIRDNFINGRHYIKEICKFKLKIVKDD